MVALELVLSMQKKKKKNRKLQNEKRECLPI
jgi:hypothetical protein